MSGTANTDSNKYSVADLLQQGLEQKPTEFKSTFDSLLGARIADAVAANKLELSQSLFGAPEGLEEPEPAEAEGKTADGETA